MNEEEFTLYEKNGNIFSIGMEFKNLLRDLNMPAMIGGGNKNHKGHLKNAGFPIGLALMNKQIKDNKIHDLHVDRTVEGGVVKEDIYNRLLLLAEDRKKTNSKTKKNRKRKKRKTRKLY